MPPGDELVESLEGLAATANREHALVHRAGEAFIEHAIRAGEALAAVKAQLPHGAWIPWLAENFGADERTAQRYVAVAANPTRVSDLVAPSLRKALAAISAGQELAGEEDAPPPELPEGVFRTVCADPPWRYGNTATRGSAENHYPTMSMEDLVALDVPALCDEDAHLYLWVTNGFLREGFDLIDAWGFTYKTCLTWVKPQMGLGNYFRGATEHVLFGVRGHLPTSSRSATNWFQAPRSKHSAKPGMFYDLVEASSPGPYLEMFARSQRLGWASWGNEALEHVAVGAA